METHKYKEIETSRMNETLRRGGLVANDSEVERFADI